ncbi:MAG: hypothetical protein CMQ81_02025, partial [Gammaproteobacteria bacterium]|nr:hypothetical protein [Gammaproteobacteria bacterium]
YWSHDLIEDRVNNKLKNTILIDVSEKIIDDKIHFKYNSAQLLLGSTLNSFLDCIDKGIIRYDSKWDVDTKGKHAGEEHNHGGGFRFHKGYNLLNLASEIIDI